MTVPGIRGALLAILASLLVSGCISAQSYIDNALPQAGKENVSAPAERVPVQLLYEFRTRGTANAQATTHTSASVHNVARDSGLFSEVSPNPVAGGRRLVVTIDNVPVTSQDDAMAKGFGTGLTLGLVGSTVTDGYVCEAVYTGASGEPVKLTFRHALHSTIGNASGPPGLKGHKPADAVKLLVEQLAWSIMRDLSRSPRL